MQYDARPGRAGRASGQLIYLMGPSGAGKDSVIDHARASLAALGVIVAGRVITRSAEAVGEKAHSVSRQQFAMLKENGAFALDWQANGLSYGIPVEVDSWLAGGSSVLVNGSRAYLETAREKYPDLIPVLLTVSEDVLRTRLESRGREGRDEIAQRLARSQRLAAEISDGVYVLDNGSTLDAAMERLFEILGAAGITAH